MLLRKLIPSRILSFAVVGGIGFIIDALIVSLLVMIYSWGPIRARLVSFTFAVCITWILNRQWTFRSGKNQKKSLELTRYYCVQMSGGGVNLLVYSLILVAVSELQHYPVVPLFFGSMVAMLFNYFAMKKYVFQGGELN